MIRNKKERIMESELHTGTVENPRVKLSSYLKSIIQANSLMLQKKRVEKKIRPSELFHLQGMRPEDELSGVYIDGVHYYDLKNIHYINNSGMASLIDLLKCSLREGIKIQFVNVDEKIKEKIKTMGLADILTCS